MDYLVICDRTGFKKLRSECRKEWDNKLVWKKVWRPKPYTIYPSPVIPPAVVPDPRPEAPYHFVGINEVKPEDI